MNKKNHIVVLTGSGISAESGIPTFRDSGGLWEGHDVYKVATPEAWEKDPEKVLRFYNDRRKQAAEAKPNEGHKALARLESQYQVTVITQNIDDLHERAGSSNVLHLHGEIKKARSTADPDLLYDIGDQAILPGDRCEKGSQLRPHVVWFGEAVPMIPKAMAETEKADLFMVIGTSLAVYPAAGLVDYVERNVAVYIVDQKIPPVSISNKVITAEEKASAALPQIVDRLINEGISTSG